MRTEITGVMARDRAPNMFADLTDSTYAYSRANGISTLTFDADLDATTVSAIRARMTSRDDADQAARADIAAHRDAAAAADLSTTDGLEALRAAVVAGLNYTLGDT